MFFTKIEKIKKIIPSVSLPREICTECFDISTSNVLQGCEKLHYVHFSNISILIALRD